MKSEHEDEIFMVPVPQKHLNLVYQTLAHAMAETDQPDPLKGTPNMNTTTPSRSGTLHLQNRDGIVWTRENLTKLRKGIRCDAPIKMLDMAAVDPGQRVYFKEVSRILGQPERTTRVQIGTITKVVKRDFGVGYDDANWPVTVGWDEDSHRMYYTMSEEVAEAWRGSKTMGPRLP